MGRKLPTLQRSSVTADLQSQIWQSSGKGLSGVLQPLTEQHLHVPCSLYSSWQASHISSWHQLKSNRPSCEGQAGWSLCHLRKAYNSIRPQLRLPGGYKGSSSSTIRTMR